MKFDLSFYWFVFMLFVMNAMCAYAVKQLRRLNPLKKITRIILLIPPIGVLAGVLLVVATSAKKAVHNYFD